MYRVRGEKGKEYDIDRVRGRRGKLSMRKRGRAKTIL